MIEAVEVFRTPDGKLFHSKTEALIHTRREAYAEAARAFIESKEWKRGQDTHALNVITEFLAFQELNG